ncbi:hypothetical protein BGZ47_004306, partial [Haplosporangium gracile]
MSRYKPTAFDPASCMQEMSEAEKDQTDHHIIQTRRKLYGGSTRPDWIDTVTLWNKDAVKAMGMGRTFAIIATRTTTTMSPSSPSLAATTT